MCLRWRRGFSWLGWLGCVSALAALAMACTRASAVDGPSPPATNAAPPPALDAGTTEAHRAASLLTTDAAAAADAAGPLPRPAVRVLGQAEIDGPNTALALAAGRPIWFAVAKPDAGARGSVRPARLVGHLHGVCGAPSYACGKWIGAGASAGLLVCPTGNAHCGASPLGPPSWEADTWPELLALMDTDLEAAIARVAQKRPGEVSREGAVLTGYSRGAYAAVPIARKHPGRWPYLVLIEADVPVTAKALRAAGVRAVAFVGGEQGTQIAGERATTEALGKEDFPARLFVMKHTGHLYAVDMEDVMRDALAFVLEH
jgi:hypothetical protein